MRKMYFSFIVKGVVAGESGHPTVIGRCGDFPIHVNDKFDKLFRYRPRHYPQEAGRAPVRDVEKEVSLRVVCIHAYERSLAELGEGMTGSMVLEGDGSEQVAPGWILGTRDDGPPGGLRSGDSLELPIGV